MSSARSSQAEVERVADTLNAINLELRKLDKRVGGNEEWISDQRLPPEHQRQHQPAAEPAAHCRRRRQRGADRRCSPAISGADAVMGRRQA
jgi:hypothetical protein